MAEIVPLSDAVEELVHDGDTVALEGFTHLIPHAAGHELIRQGRRDLTLVRMTPDVVYDQLIGAGCARKLVFSWGGNPGRRLAAPVPRRGRARLAGAARARGALARRAWRRPTRPGASSLPFGVLRGYAGTDLVGRTDSLAEIECPFTGEALAAVRGAPARRRDRARAAGRPRGQRAALGHHRRAEGDRARVGALARDGRGDRRRARAAPRRRRAPGLGDHARSPRRPGGAHPSYAHGYYERDNAFYVGWDAISRDRDAFTAWMRRHVLETADVDEYQRSLAEAEVAA